MHMRTFHAVGTFCANATACLLILSISIFISIPTLLMGGISNTAVIDRMDRDLDFVYNTLEAGYGPFAWKVQHFQWNLAAEVEKAKQALAQATSPSYALYRRALKSLLLSMKDYHVSIQYYTTEGAFLPFRIAGANGHYYISYYPGPAGQLSGVGSLHVGDEVLAFDDQPIADAIAALKSSDLSGAVPMTDERLAQIYLTTRVGESGFTVPQGTMYLTFKSASTGAISRIPFAWQYQPDQISNPSLTTLGFAQPKVSPASNHLFARQMVFPGIRGLRAFALPRGDTRDYNELAARQSFIPDLGSKMWSSSDTDLFYAYIFQSPKGKRIGYVRIPSYEGGEQEAQAFGHLIAHFQSQTDALVIDQVNNPGGSVFYLYSLASYLTNKSLVLPRHHVRITQADASTAMQALHILQTLKTELDAQGFLGSSLDGYPVNMTLVQQMVDYYQFILEEWDRSALLTDPYPLYGVDHIVPAPGVVYTKPILVLINSLDFSGADFFPAIMQDNHRVTLFGQRTAGAGGYVAELDFQNIFGVEAIQYTASLAERLSQNPIENLGVLPDVHYAMTRNDIQNGYLGYKKAILKAVDNLFPGAQVR